MKKIITLICSALYITVSFTSNAQEDMVSYTLNANEPIIGCKIVAIKDSDDLGKIESIDGSFLNLRIHRNNVYRVTINEKKVYLLQYEDHTGFAQVDGINLTRPNGLDSWSISSDEAANSEPGIKYRIQIGAFANRVSDYSFKQLGQLYTQEIDGGILRYMIGSYSTREEAAAAQAEIRSMGYPDAFTVVCNNGKRVSFNEAEEWSAQN